MFGKRSNFSYKPEDYLKGKTICVTGTIKEYKGKPQIVVDKEDQIKVR
jgi:DNA/RNA endonuclease YhcR with UshA esterase domain